MGDGGGGEYLEKTSPRKAFPFAISGGWNFSCAFAKCCIAGGGASEPILFLFSSDGLISRSKTKLRGEVCLQFLSWGIRTREEYPSFVSHRGGSDQSRSKDSEIIQQRLCNLAIEGRRKGNQKKVSRHDDCQESGRSRLYISRAIAHHPPPPNTLIAVHPS